MTECTRSNYDLEYERLYRRFRGNNGCVYCGEDAFQLDHVVPISRVDEVDRGFVLVDCCGECNVTASNWLFDSFEEKRKYIHECLEREFNLRCELKYYKGEDVEIQQLRLWRRQRQSFPSNADIAKYFSHLSDSGRNSVVGIIRRNGTSQES